MERWKANIHFVVLILADIDSLLAGTIGQEELALEIVYTKH